MKKLILALLFFITPSLPYAKTPLAVLDALGPLFDWSVDWAPCPDQNYNDYSVNHWLTVPNFDQGDYPGPNDCGPVAGAMQLGYLEEQGSYGIVPDWKGEFEWEDKSNGVINDLVVDLKKEMPYDEDGTWTWNAIVPPKTVFKPEVAYAVHEVARQRYQSAFDWSYHDGWNIDFSLVQKHMWNSNPVLLMTLYVSGKKFKPNKFSDATSAHTTVQDTKDWLAGETYSWHWMPIIRSRKLQVIGGGTMTITSLSNDWRWEYIFPCFEIGGASNWFYVRSGWVSTPTAQTAEDDIGAWVVQHKGDVGWTNWLDPLDDFYYARVNDVLPWIKSPPN